MTAPLSEDALFSELSQTLTQQKRSPEEIELVRLAFEYGRQMHEGQRRKNNENYIVHPVSVALILSDIQVDIPTLQAAILHDVLEDTPATSAELQKRFGEEVTSIVEGVTKLGKFEFSSAEERQAENFRRMFLAMANDIRVILVKLGDRLHNMRTLCFMKPEKQLKISAETLEIFAPLANRMGMGKIRAELEDLSLLYLNEEKYREIEAEISQSKAEWEKTLEQVTQRIQSQLQPSQIEAKVYGRVKNYYSIYKKMLTRQKKVQDVYDLSAVRVIVSNERECYEVLGVVHNAFKPIPGRFKDYIAMPKSNLYQSLHTTVIGPYGQPLEVQIRTKEMHRIAEYGIAAHWKYKETGSSASAATSDDQKLSWLKQMIEMKESADDAQEYVDSVKLDLFRDEVFVFSPKGKVVDLPRGSTPVDFAYRIHTEVGNTCTGAKVNGKIVTLDYELHNGDIVDILTNKRSTPRLDWIKFVQTQQAKTRIRQWFKKNFKEEHEAQGRQLIEAELTKNGVEELIRSGRMMDTAKELNYTCVEDLFTALGAGEINAPRVINRLKKYTAHATQATEGAKDNLPKMRPVQQSHKNYEHKDSEIEGLQGMLYHLAKCCTPVPGEEIIGVVTRSRGVMVHRDDCSNLSHVNPDRQMVVEWGRKAAEKQASSKHSVKLEAHVIDRVGVLKDILGKIADTRTNLSNTKVRMHEDNTAIIEVTIDVENVDHLERVQQAIRKVPDVISVKRHQFRVAKPGGKSL